jgi:L,D-transpeptidase-like protein
MRVARARLGAAGGVVAGLIGGGVLFGTASIANDVPGSDAGIRSWYERFEMRMNPPPDSIAISIGPWEAPLRRLNPDDPRPLVPPYARPPLVPFAPPSHEIAPQKPSTPLITRFADDKPVADDKPIADDSQANEKASLASLPDTPEAKPLANVDAVDLAKLLASVVVPTGPVRVALPPPVRIAPTQRSGNAVASIPVDNVADRLRNRLSRDLYANFDLFLYVSKSSDGPLAQHMYVFAKAMEVSNAARLTLLHDWPVSTGRETLEIDARGTRTSTTTPAGYYQLDPKRFYRKYTSGQWKKPMPNSMFFDWMVKGYRTGLAIHGVSAKDEVKALGTRYSAGCVHLSPDAARSLFEMIKAGYKGMIPQFAYNRRTHTVSNDGKLARAKDGRLQMVEGYKALVVIENYGGQDLLTNLEVDKGRPRG